MKKSSFGLLLACLAIFLWASSCQSPSSTGTPSSTPIADNTKTAAGNTGTGSGSGSGSGSDTTTTTGLFTLNLMDAPVKDAKNIWLTFSKIRVHQACETEDDCFITVWENPANTVAVDLLALKDHPFVFAAGVELPVGKYNQIRMAVIKGEIVFGPPGLPDPVNDKTYPLDVPSDEIKTNLHFEILSGSMTEITLDLDGEKSIHVIQNGKKEEYKLRPVISVVKVETSPVS